MKVILKEAVIYRNYLAISCQTASGQKVMKWGFSPLGYIEAFTFYCIVSPLIAVLCEGISGDVNHCVWWGEISALATVLPNTLSCIVSFLQATPCGIWYSTRSKQLVWQDCARQGAWQRTCGACNHTLPLRMSLQKYRAVSGCKTGHSEMVHCKKDPFLFFSKWQHNNGRGGIGCVLAVVPRIHWCVQCLISKVRGFGVQA